MSRKLCFKGFGVSQAQQNVSGDNNSQNISD